MFLRGLWGDICITWRAGTEEAWRMQSETGRTLELLRTRPPGDSSAQRDDPGGAWRIRLSSFGGLNGDYAAISGELDWMAERMTMKRREVGLKLRVRENVADSAGVCRLRRPWKMSGLRFGRRREQIAKAAVYWANGERSLEIAGLMSFDAPVLARWRRILRCWRNSDLWN